MRQRAAGATLFLLLAGVALLAPAGALAGDPPSFWEKLRIRDRHRDAAGEGTDVPKAVARTQVTLRASALSRDPEAKAWMDLVDRGQAGAGEFNDFAALLVRKAHFAEASTYQKAAIELEPRDPTLWVNFAMIERSLGRTSNTRAACNRALSLDPNHALAHYVMGTVHEASKDFDRAIAEYRTALQLDPRLGEAKYNALAAYNEHLDLVKMLNYRDRTGSIGLPMVTLTPGPPPATSKNLPATEEPAAAAPAPAKPRKPAEKPRPPASGR